MGLFEAMLCRDLERFFDGRTKDELRDCMVLVAIRMKRLREGVDIDIANFYIGTQTFSW